MSPRSVPVACSFPLCADYAVERGRCARHRRTTSERGYGARWQKLSREQRSRAPECAVCGATDDLVTDHVRNGDARYVQTLCRACNTAKRNRERASW